MKCFIAASLANLHLDRMFPESGKRSLGLHDNSLDILIQTNPRQKHCRPPVFNDYITWTTTYKISSASRTWVNDSAAK